MKKILILLLILVLIPAVLMTGCGGSESAPEGDQPDVVQEEQSEETSEVTEGMGDLLSAAYVDIMKDNEYLMSYKATMEYEGQSTVMEATIAAVGDDMAIASSGDGFETNMVIKDDKIYMIDHGSKTVTSFAQTEEMVDQVDTGTFETEGMDYIGSGKEDGLVFEEYAIPEGSVKYYFDGKELLKMAMITESGTMMMDIIELSDNVPSSMFDIPAGYQQIEM